MKVLGIILYIAGSLFLVIVGPMLYFAIFIAPAVPRGPMVANLATKAV